MSASVKTAQNRMPNRTWMSSLSKCEWQAKIQKRTELSTLQSKMVNSSTNDVHFDGDSMS